MKKIELYGSNWCTECRIIRDFLTHNQLGFNYINTDEDDEAASKLLRLNNGRIKTPVVVVNGISFSNPTLSILELIIGLPTISI